MAAPRAMASSGVSRYFFDGRLRQEAVFYPVLDTPDEEPHQMIYPASLETLQPLQHLEAEGEDEQPLPEIRSQMLHNFKNPEYKQFFRLENIFHHLAEFSTDQEGSRFIQESLDSASNVDRRRVYEELRPNIIELCCDNFGNYVVQKLLDHGSPAQKRDVAWMMRGRLYALSTDQYSCRVVQAVLLHTSPEDTALLADELDGRYVEMMTNQSANFVIQRLIVCAPPQTVHRITRSIIGHVVKLSQSMFGCRVLQRCFERGDPEANCSAIALEAADQAAMLITDTYGNYVAQHICEHLPLTSPAKQRVMELVRSNFIAYGRCRHASNVVDHAILGGGEDYALCMARLMLEPQPRREWQNQRLLTHLVRHEFGNYNVQAVLKSLAFDKFIEFLEYLRPAVHEAWNLPLRGDKTVKSLRGVEKSVNDRFAARAEPMGFRGMPVPPCNGQGQTAHSPPRAPAADKANGNLQGGNFHAQQPQGQRSGSGERSGNRNRNRSRGGGNGGPNRNNSLHGKKSSGFNGVNNAHSHNLPPQQQTGGNQTFKNGAGNAHWRKDSGAVAVNALGNLTLGPSPPQHAAHGVAVSTSPSNSDGTSSSTVLPGRPTRNVGPAPRPSPAAPAAAAAAVQNDRSPWSGGPVGISTPYWGQINNSLLSSGLDAYGFSGGNKCFAGWGGAVAPPAAAVTNATNALAAVTGATNAPAAPPGLVAPAPGAAPGANMPPRPPPGLEHVGPFPAPDGAMAPPSGPRSQLSGASASFRPGSWGNQGGFGSRL